MDDVSLSGSVWIWLTLSSLSMEGLQFEWGGVGPTVLPGVRVSGPCHGHCLITWQGLVSHVKCSHYTPSAG